MRRRLATLPLLAALAFAGSVTARAQSTDNLLLVVNDASQASVQVADAYIGRHSLRRDLVLHIRTGTTDAIDRPKYSSEIETPISSFLAAHSLQDQILYIVLTKGIPLRINGSGGLGGSMASVDSELSLLYRRMVGLAVPVEGRVANPYFLGDQPVADAKHFTRFVADTYLVTRLDGFTADDVLKLIDRAAAPAQDGTIVLDQKATVIDRGGDSWLQETADRLGAAKTTLPVVSDTTKAIASVTGPVLAYYSWGSNDPAQVHQRHTGLQFAAGSIGGTFVSTDGRTFTEPPPDWTPSAPLGGPVYAGSFQSLAGDLISRRPDGRVRARRGALSRRDDPPAEFSHSRATCGGSTSPSRSTSRCRFSSWQTVIVRGSIVCAPFGGAPLPKDQLFQDIDPATELPALFAGRRLAVLTRVGTNADAAKLVLKASARRARDPQADVEALLLQAVSLEPKFTMVLALYYESRGDIPKGDRAVPEGHRPRTGQRARAEQPRLWAGGEPALTEATDAATG